MPETGILTDVTDGEFKFDYNVEYACDGMLELNKGAEGVEDTLIINNGHYESVIRRLE